MNSLISIIVPVYNVEEYLDECVQSLVNQTYTNIEIILVDDGSPDRCPDMCDEWANRDNRIRVIHKVNGGLSSARNVGIENATGDYLSFVDSDDFFDKMMYEKLYEGTTRSPNIGISAIKFYKYEDGVVSIYNPNWDTKKDILVKAEDFGILTLKQEICHAATNKLYKRSLLENVHFRLGRLNEDVLFMHDLSRNVRKHNCDMWDLSYYAYYYRMRPGSIGHSSTPLYIAVIDNMKEIMEEATDIVYKTISQKMYYKSIYEFCAHLLTDQSPNGTILRKKYFKKYRYLLSSIKLSDLIEEKDNYVRFSISFYLIKYVPCIYMFFFLIRNFITSRK